MSRQEDIKNAVVDVVADVLYDPVEYLAVSEIVADEYGEYSDDEDFISEVYNLAGSELKKIFEQYTGK